MHLKIILKNISISLGSQRIHESASMTTPRALIKRCLLTRGIRDRGNKERSPQPSCCEVHSLLSVSSHTLAGVTLRLSSHHPWHSDLATHTQVIGSNFNDVGRDQSNTTTTNLTLILSLFNVGHAISPGNDEVPQARPSSRALQPSCSRANDRPAIRRFPYFHQSSLNDISSAAELIARIVQDLRDPSEPGSFSELGSELQKLLRALLTVDMAIKNYERTPLHQSLVLTIHPVVAHCHIQLRGLRQQVDHYRKSLKSTTISRLWRPVFGSGLDDGDLAPLRTELSVCLDHFERFSTAFDSYVLLSDGRYRFFIYLAKNRMDAIRKRDACWICTILTGSQRLATELFLAGTHPRTHHHCHRSSGIEYTNTFSVLFDVGGTLELIHKSAQIIICSTGSRLYGQGILQKSRRPSLRRARRLSCPTRCSDRTPCKICRQRRTWYGARNEHHLAQRKRASKLPQDMSAMPVQSHERRRGRLG